jgi:hypothetical protein
MPPAPLCRGRPPWNIVMSCAPRPSYVVSRPASLRRHSVNLPAPLQYYLPTSSRLRPPALSSPAASWAVTGHRTWPALPQLPCAPVRLPSRRGWALRSSTRACRPTSDVMFFFRKKWSNILKKCWNIFKNVGQHFNLKLLVKTFWKKMLDLVLFLNKCWCLSFRKILTQLLW